MPERERERLLQNITLDGLANSEHNISTNGMSCHVIFIHFLTGMRKHWSNIINDSVKVVNDFNCITAPPKAELFNLSKCEISYQSVI